MRLWTFSTFILEYFRDGLQGQLSKVKDLSFYYSLTSLFFYSFIMIFIYFVFNTQVQTHGYTSSVQGSGMDPTFGTAYMHPENTRLGLVCFSLKEVRSYFRKVSGV